MDSLRMDGKVALVTGVANQRSIAWAIAKALHTAGATLVFTYQGERLKETVEELAGSLGSELVLPCDVTDEEEVAAVAPLTPDQFLAAFSAQGGGQEGSPS